MDVNSEDFSEGDQRPEEPSAHAEPGTIGPEKRPVHRLACDHCRLKKVGCDRRDPCSTCARTKNACNYSGSQRGSKKRPRVYLTEKYQDKIDRLSWQVDALSKHLENAHHRDTPQTLRASRTSRHATPRATLAGSSPETTSSQVHAAGSNPPTPEYEGDSALSAHTAFATRFLKTAVNKDRSMAIPPEAASALHDLQQHAKDASHAMEPLHEQLPNATNPGLQPSTPAMTLPPSLVVFAGLQMAREIPRVRISWTFEFESIEHFQEYFVRVYSSSHTTVAERIIVFLGLFNLFSECACAAGDAEWKSEYQKQSALCRDNLETLLANLPFHMPSTYDYVLALAMAANYSVERCRPTLAWNFNCTAARMSQALGFHKAAMEDTGSECLRRKARLFAVIYMADKMLSLRLGRGSMLRDEEVPLDAKAMLKLVNTAPIKLLPVWLSFARVQGLVYDKLYSPEALRQTPHIIEERAWALVRESDDLLNEDCHINARFEREVCNALGDELLSILKRGHRVAVLSLKCLIHRNIPPADGSGAAFNDECICLAREALAEHQACVVSLSHHESRFLEIYYNWALLTSPFVPFIVLLCNVVETYSPDDLSLLGAMIASIEEIREVMPTISRQLKLFRPLFEVASKFVEAKMAPVPPAGDFGAFYQESNMELSFDSALLSTFNQGQQPDVARVGDTRAIYGDASILDVWSYLDSPYYN